MTDDFQIVEQITHSIGDRPVVGHGTLVLGRSDNNCSINLGRLQIIFAFVLDPGALAADAQPVGENALRIRFTGMIDGTGASYELQNVVVWNNQWLHLAVIIHAVTEVAIVRQISYTLTGTPGPI